MNNVQKGYSRDKRILDWIEMCGSLTADQVAILECKEMKNGRRKAQERLKRLVDTRQLQRGRVAVHMPYVYYLDKLADEHRVGVNWVLVWFRAKLRSWEKIAWEYEPDYGFMRPDLLVVIENTVTKRSRGIYVELDRSNNKWDKTPKYNKLYLEEPYKEQWWVKKVAEFPSILAVSTSPARVRMIREQIAKEDACDLRFEVKLLEVLRREVCPWQ